MLANIDADIGTRSVQRIWRRFVPFDDRDRPLDGYGLPSRIAKLRRS